MLKACYSSIILIEKKSQSAPYFNNILQLTSPNGRRLFKLRVPFLCKFLNNITKLLDVHRICRFTFFFLRWCHPSLLPAVFGLQLKFYFRPLLRILCKIPLCHTKVDTFHNNTLPSLPPSLSTSIP